MVLSDGELLTTNFVISVHVQWLVRDEGFCMRFIMYKPIRILFHNTHLS